MKSIIDNKGLPLIELLIVMLIGILALLAVLVLFQKREFK